MKAPLLFRYSGNKRNIVPLLRPLEVRPKRVVEPYLGSGSFMLSRFEPGLGIDTNEDIVALWKWLRDEASPSKLFALAKRVNEAVEAHPEKKPDVRELELERGPETYVRVNCSGVYAGQLSSWVLYPQHKLPARDTSKMLHRLKNIEIIHGDAGDYQEQDGDVVLLDPPYVGTRGNYKEAAKSGIEESYSPQQTIDLIARLSCPVILTYGDGADETFPQYEWKQVVKKKVPNIRKGGTVERSENVAYINW
tara:strand:- start:26632 stop:27381 length:750 start_codon:yes stop_codon:yes gene_type:complete